MTALVTALSSCATVKRALSVNSSDPLASPETLLNEYGGRGEIKEVWYDCSIEGPSRRRMLVYLPESYAKSEDRRYPVLYLLHGARGNETSWFTEGTAATILDSLWQNNLAEEFIAVMCNMNQYDDDADFANSRFKQPFESFFETSGAVETSFIDDVVNRVDSTFRTIPTKKSRAIAGLSVGGMQSIYISAANPDMFDYIGLFSPFYKGPVMKGKYASFFDGIYEKLVKQFSKPPALYFIEIGYWDFFAVHNEYFRRYLTLHNFTYEFIETGGGHTWDNWRNYLATFTKKIF